jgi:hypothetical protein
MGQFSVWHWLIVLVYALILIVPFWRIFPRAGMPSPLSILMGVPLVNIVLLWVLAFKRWPGDA